MGYFAQKLHILRYFCVHLILEIRLFLLLLCLLKLKGCHAHSLTGGVGKLLFLCVNRLGQTATSYWLLTVKSKPQIKDAFNCT